MAEAAIMTIPRDAIGLSDRLLAEIGQPVIYRNDAVLREAATALDALQARVEELEARQAEDLAEFGLMEIRALRAEQERDEAYERAANYHDRQAFHFIDLASEYRSNGHASTSGLFTRDAGFHERSAAAIRRLAAGTEKEPSS